MYIGDLLNKIKWDKNLKPGEYEIIYFDRIERKEFSVKFLEISREGSFFVVKRNGKEVSIPLHRITKVLRNGKVVWDRS